MHEPNIIWFILHLLSLLNMFINAALALVVILVPNAIAAIHDLLAADHALTFITKTINPLFTCALLFIWNMFHLEGISLNMVPVKWWNMPGCLILN